MRNDPAGKKPWVLHSARKIHWMLDSAGKTPWIQKTWNQNQDLRIKPQESGTKNQESAEKISRIRNSKLQIRHGDKLNVNLGARNPPASLLKTSTQPQAS